MSQSPGTLAEQRVAVVEAENDVLRMRVTELEAMLGMTFVVPPILALTGTEAKLLGFLLSRDVITKEAAMTCLYGLRPDGDDVEIKIIDVYVCKLRRKLKAFGIGIETRWGNGYFMTAEAKAAILALMPKREAA